MMVGNDERRGEARTLSLTSMVEQQGGGVERKLASVGPLAGVR